MSWVQPSLVQALRGVLAVSLAVVAIEASAQSPWKIVELKAPPGAFYVKAFSVDQNRDVFGQVQMAAGMYRPVRWRAKANYAPEFLGTENGYARGSYAGYVVGEHLMDGPEGGPISRPVKWSPNGSFEYLEGLPPYRLGEGIAVNPSMVVAGTIWSEVSNGFRAFRWKDGGGSELPALAGYGHSWATGINSAGFIVGYGFDNYNAPTKAAGWIWSPTGGLQKLPTVGGYYRALGLNNSGLICGSGRAGGGLSAGVVWPIFGKAIVLGTLAGYPNAEAVAVNDDGDVAGNVWAGTWSKKNSLRPVSWIDGELHDIAAEAGVPATVKLGPANGNNKHGDVVGEGNFSGRNSGYLAIRR